MTATEKTRRVNFGEVNDGHVRESQPANCVAADSNSILAEELDNLLQTMTAERALPRIALELHPELRGTVWHRVAWSTASTLIAHALLGAEKSERTQDLARWVAQIITAEGKVTTLDGKVLVLGDGVAVAFGDRSFYVRRTDG